MKGASALSSFFVSSSSSSSSLLFVKSIYAEIGMVSETILSMMSAQTSSRESGREMTWEFGENPAKEVSRI